MTVSRTNLATNPSFESGTTGMGGAANAAGSATVGLSTDWAASGTRSLKVTGNGTLDYSGAYPWGGLGAAVLTRMGVVAGKTYTVSADFYQSVLQDTSWPVVARGMWFGPTGSTNDMWAKGEVPNAIGTQRVTCTFSIPAGTTQMNAAFTMGSKTGSGYYDNVMVVEGDSTGPYFDGSTAAHDNVAYRWAGTANASASEEYYVLPTVLVEELEPSPAPSVGITVVALGATPTVFNVWRVAAGRRTLVRGGRNREAVDSDYLEDYEVPFNIPVTYEVEIISGPGVTQQTYGGTITVASTVGWMQDPLVPGSAIPVDGYSSQDGRPVLMSPSLSELLYEADVSYMKVMGSADPVALIGQRASAAGLNFNLLTKAAEHSNDLRDLTMSGGILLVRPVAPWGDPLPPLCYIAAGAVKEGPRLSRTGDPNSGTDWDVTSPLVKAPSMDVLVPRWTWGDVEALYATWGQAETALAGKTWLDVTKNPTGA